MRRPEKVLSLDPPIDDAPRKFRRSRRGVEATGRRGDGATGRRGMTAMQVNREDQENGRCIIF